MDLDSCFLIVDGPCSIRKRKSLLIKKENKKKRVQNMELTQFQHIKCYNGLKIPFISLINAV